MMSEQKFHSAGQMQTRRVIATVGAMADIDRGGNGTVNGELPDEPYLTEKALGQ